MAELVIPDDGYADVSINDVTRKIDIYRTYNLLIDCGERVRDQYPDDERDAAKRAVAYFDAVADVLKGAGFEFVSHRAAERFEVAFMGAVDELKKADAPAPTPA